MAATGGDAHGQGARGRGRGTAIGTGIGITEEHRALAHSVRGWLARAAPPGEVRKLLDAEG
ncbi:hypothetical protein GTW37_36730, partial [Streptomyces sp. SID4931]